MLKIEEVKLTNTQVKNHRIIRVMNNWIKSKTYYSSVDEKFPSSSEIQKRTKGRYIKVSCPEGYYIKIPKINGKQLMFTTSSDDNYLNKELSIYSNKPNEYLIELSDGLVDMEDKDTLYKRFVLYVLSNSDDKIEKYGVIITLEYKNNGLIGNPDFAVETGVSIHHFNDSYLVYNAIDITFFALLIFQIVKWSIKGCIDNTDKTGVPTGFEGTKVPFFMRKDVSVNGWTSRQNKNP